MTDPNAPVFDAELDALLGPALTPPARGSDASFATRVDLAVDEAHRYAEARRRAWARFGIEGASAASLGVGLWLISRAPALAPFVDDTAMLKIASPLTLVMLLWVATNRWRIDERA